MKSPRAEWWPGTLDMLILKTLSQSPQHGYGIARELRRRSQEFLHVQEGTLYPALHRLEQLREIDSYWGASDANRRARYYRLTARGKRKLEQRRSAWQRMAQAITQVLSGADPGMAAEPSP
ncbi:MAG: PadR family transcriptional regulator [Planctomycetota bacterium]